MLTLKDLRIVKSRIELLDALFVKFPVREVLEMILEIADLQCINLLLNLDSFLTNQIVLMRLIKSS
jgi:hypothetical protein